MMVAAFSHAMNMHYVHTLKKIVPPFVNVHYSHLGFLFVNSLMSIFNPHQIYRAAIDLPLVLLMLAITVATLFTQYGIFLANTIKSPSLMMPLGYVSVLIGFWADVSLFDTQFTLLSVVGMMLTSAGLLSGYLLSKDSKDSPSANKETSSGQQIVSN
jgi:drug/metabolite transporter (DMT)-like permease